MNDANADSPLIAHIIHRFSFGGLENGLVNLVNNLPCDAYRHAIICLTDYTEFSERLERDDVSLIALHKRDGKDVACYLRLWRALRQLNPDIVHTRNLAALDSQAVAALAGVRRRVHGEHGWDVVDLHGENRKYLALRRFFRRLIAVYIPMSRHLADWLRNRIRVPESKITQIYNGVDIERFHPRSEQHDDDAPLTIGTVGRLHPVKDQLTLVRAFVALRQRGLNLRLLIVGDGPSRGEIERLLAGSGCAAQAEITGATDSVPELLRRMDVFALPSLNEGISNTLLEAMASGLPVVATRVGGNPELVHEDHNGLLVPSEDAQALADAIARYVDDPELRRRHGQAGRERVCRDFSLATMVDGYRQVYDRLLAS